LLFGAACAALILTLGLNAWRYTDNTPVSIAQCVFLFVISGLSLMGIAASAFTSDWLRASRTLRVLFVCPAAMFPLNDLFPIFAGGEWSVHLISALVISAVVASIVATAVASSWLPAFVGGAEDADG
jgi:hypothetical protein